MVNDESSPRIPAPHIPTDAVGLSPAQETPSAQHDRLMSDYDDLRRQLRTLSSAPLPDRKAIEHTMALLDETHAAFKALHKGDDHQRY